MAGPVGGASGTEFGGIGGGRSENIWAGAGPGTSASHRASADSRRGPLATPPPATPVPLKIMAMLFTENAANSSLRDPGVFALLEPNGPPSL
jgi:hypothetical protein